MILAETTGNPASFFRSVTKCTTTYRDLYDVCYKITTLSLSRNTSLHILSSNDHGLPVFLFLDTQSIFLMLSRRGIKCHNKFFSRRAVARQRVLVQLGTFLAIRIQIIILDGA